MQTNPQLENGYLRIANELYDAVLKFPFSKRELLVVLAVIRKTYGYGKKEDDMTMTQLADLTGLQRTHIGETVSELQDKNVLLIRDGSYGKVIGLSKNYKNWKKSPKTVHRPKLVRPPSQIGTHTVPNQDADVTKSVHTIDNPKRQSQKTTPIVPSGLTTPTWNAYSDSYFKRYGVEPVRNAMVSGQLSQFLKRIPMEEAPHIAGYYVQHNNAFYVTKGHPIGLLLQDAEKLRTEWATKRQITSTAAKQADKTQSNISVYDEVARERGLT